MPPRAGAIAYLRYAFAMNSTRVIEELRERHGLVEESLLVCALEPDEARVLEHAHAHHRVGLDQPERQRLPEQEA